MIKIVTDSTAYLDKNFAKEKDIKIVPLKVSFGEKYFIDGVDITPDEFYRLLEENENLPKTSQPSIDDFINVYKPILEKDNDIISIHISSGLSGTINVAEVAKKKLNTKRICIVDSLSTALVLQFLIEKALDLIKNGESFEYVCTAVRAQVKKMLSRFIMYNLDYMIKGGRLNKAEALVGSILHIKPILSFTDGKGRVEGITRTWKKARRKLLAYVDEVNKNIGIEKIGVHYGANLEEAKAFKNDIEDIVEIPVRMLQIGSVLGTYAGARWLGLAIQTK